MRDPFDGLFSASFSPESLPSIPGGLSVSPQLFAACPVRGVEGTEEVTGLLRRGGEARGPHGPPCWDLGNQTLSS